MSSRVVTTDNEVHTPANQAIYQFLNMDSPCVFLCRAIASVGGGFAFGWSLRGWLGSLIGAAVGLAAFAVTQKNNR